MPKTIMVPRSDRARGIDLLLERGQPAHPTPRIKRSNSFAQCILLSILHISTKRLFLQKKQIVTLSLMPSAAVAPALVSRA